MSNLNQLANAAMESLETSKTLQEYRRKRSNRKTHTFIGNLDTFKSLVYQGIKSQRSRGWKPTKRQDEELTRVVKEYLSSMHSILTTPSSSKVFTYRFIGGTPDKFTAVVMGNGNVEGHIQLLRRNANINKVSNTIKRIFDRPGKKIEVDVGHMEGSTVAEQFATEMIQRFESVGNIAVDTSALEKLKVRIKYDPLSSKLAQIYVEDQFGLVNQSTTEEAEITALLGQALGKSFVQKEAINLIEPRVNHEINKFLDVAKKSGAKVSKKLPVSKGGSITLTKNLKSKGGIPSGRTIDGPDKIILDKEGADQDWASLISIINSKLESRVAQNMGSPRLVYRTGRFAASTEVKSIEMTKQGYPTFVFDYMRDPYDVFDKSDGASPWNTPERDPKTLISASIRDIVKELAVGRFYTRRA